MRADAVGFFWDDTPPPKPPKVEKVKRTPPEPVWLRPDYLPGLAEAQQFRAPLMSIDELVQAAARGEELVLDVEIYPNYFLIAFLSMQTGRVFYLEMVQGADPLNTQLLSWILNSFRTCGFNSFNYDLTMCALAIAGATTSQLQDASNEIIVHDYRAQDVLRSRKVARLQIDHIDLIEVAPLHASLKTYAGRLHAPRMQDLPFAPGTVLSQDQIVITRWYCVNDITNTAFLRQCVDEQIRLRADLSNEYRIDLRSKSDAQIAEVVIGAEMTKRSGSRPQRPHIEVGTAYKYQVPHFLQYRSDLLNWALNTVRNANFVVEHTGSIGMPEEIKALNLEINGSVYRMGIGGLHSSETTQAHFTDDTYVLIDKDVTSYYPFIILNLGLYPHHLGPAFLSVYRSIVDRRIQAKRAGNKVSADSLKIVVNGSFGKLGSKYSILYSPDLLIQVTLTGQLSLLMLIERLELAGIHVVSANTDGIVIKCPRAKIDLMNNIVAQWEKDTNFSTEETRYLALYSRDVNNYIAIKQTEDKDPSGGTVWVEAPAGTKNKGTYANPWAGGTRSAWCLHKNPTCTICVEAVEAYLTQGAPIDHTIRSSTDIRKFVAVRTVKGGAVKVWDQIIPEHSSREDLIQQAGFVKFADGSWTDVAHDTQGIYARSTERAYEDAKRKLAQPGPTEYLGKSIRWYYARNVEGEIVYASNGNKVPRSDGAMPLMQLPDTFPSDVDHEWYIEEANKILRQIGSTYS